MLKSVGDYQGNVEITKNVAVGATTECPVDIIFVLDDSASIGEANFILSKSFLSQLVARLNIGSGRTRVGLVKYSANVNAHICLNSHSSVASLQSAILALYFTSGTSTNTHLALDYVRTTMLTPACGDRGKVPNVVVVLTDGQSSNANYTRVSILNLLRAVLPAYSDSSKQRCLYEYN